LNVVTGPPLAEEQAADEDGGAETDEDEGEETIDLSEFAEELELAEEAEESVDEEEDEGAIFPSSYLASLAKELSAAITDWDTVAPARQEAIKSYIEGVSKPGLIIDGQHRVFGAKNVSEHDVRLPVILLPGLAYSEQVFQFYVLNSKARPLKPTE